MFRRDVFWSAVVPQKSQTMQHNCNCQWGLPLKVRQFCAFCLYRYTSFFSEHLTYYPFKLCGRHCHLSYQLWINAVFRYLASDCSVINVTFWRTAYQQCSLFKRWSMILSSSHSTNRKGIFFQAIFAWNTDYASYDLSCFEWLLSTTIARKRKVINTDCSFHGRVNILRRGTESSDKKSGCAEVVRSDYASYLGNKSLHIFSLCLFSWKHHEYTPSSVTRVKAGPEERLNKAAESPQPWRGCGAARREVVCQETAEDPAEGTPPK